MSAAEILEHIRRLPEMERREVVERIQDEFLTFDDELTQEQVAELERRAADSHANPERGIPWETLRDELFERYKVKR